MEAKNDVKAQSVRVRYEALDWGDLITGTKEQLQAFGLGIGLAFPGEPGAPRRQLSVRDPRGFPVRISNLYPDEGSFSASIGFPNWPDCSTEGPWIPVFRSVKMSKSLRLDKYVGSASDLATMGIVRLDQLPGMPGMRKIRVTIFPDGTLPTGSHKANHREARLPGARFIGRAPKSQYLVRILVSTEGAERRSKAYAIAFAECRDKIRSLPGPERLQAMAPERRQCFKEDCARASRDVQFQSFLARQIPAIGNSSGCNHA